MTCIPTFAPGCFGSALAFQADHFICKACPFNSQCLPAHESNLSALRERFGITSTRRGPKLKPATNPVGNASAMVLPVKVQKLIDRLDVANLRIGEKLSAGENPFEGKIPFLQITCHLLLRLRAPVTRDILCQAFTKKLGWQQNTAEAHARMAFQALAHIGVIVDSEAGAVLKKG